MAHVVADASEPVQILLNKVKTAIGHVGKGERNTAQGFNFRGIDAVVNAAAPYLNEHGIITVPEVLEYSYDTVEVGAKRTAMGHVLLKAKYHFYGPAGDEVAATVMSESMDSGDKAMAKAMSVAYRIALLQVLNLPTTEPDPDSESFERSGKTGGTAEWANAGKTIPAPKVHTPRQTAEKQPWANPQESAIEAAAADSLDQLRNTYKGAMAAGFMQTEIAEPGSGDKMTLEKYLMKRGDDLKFRASAKSIAGRRNGAGGTVIAASGAPE